MFKEKKIVLTINPGSTTTKVKVFLHEDASVLYEGKLQDTNSFRSFLRQLEDANELVFGIRVVHGGEQDETVQITEEVISQIEKYTLFAPIHNTLALKRIRDIRELFPRKKI